MNFVHSGSATVTAGKTGLQTRASQFGGVSLRQFNHRQLSRPASLAEASSRVSYNMRNFSGNYLVIVIILAVCAL